MKYSENDNKLNKLLIDRISKLIIELEDIKKELIWQQSNADITNAKVVDIEQTEHITNKQTKTDLNKGYDDYDNTDNLPQFSM